jgi:hypothetical protein
MAFHLTTEGTIAEITPENERPEDAAQRVIRTRDEWVAIAGQWRLKQLVAIWNRLPGVTPVEKFTSRPIALERIWRVLELPEPSRRNTLAKGGKPKVHFREGSKAAQAYGPALPAGGCDGARTANSHGLAAAYGARFPFGQCAQTGLARAVVRTGG